jgi:alpha-amylase/alpha-mannosidase (GH57 family)
MSEKLNVTFCWHMHQPWYRDAEDGSYHLPWVYLHALKDYTDMAAHLENHPGMRCVVNFTPVLIEQIEDYASQCQNWLDKGTDFRDPLLNYLAGNRPVPSNTEERLDLVRSCLRAHAIQMINPYPSFRHLVNLATIKKDQNNLDEETLKYLNDQFFLDLLTWYHLTWLGYSIQQQDAIQSLMKQGSDFTDAQRRQLIGIFSRELGQLLSRYRKLSESDQVELSMTPYAHPIMPLLLDFDSLHDASPEAPMPASPCYPGGVERAHWHMQHGIEVFERVFGCKPGGVWLSEGAVSEKAVRLLQDFDIKWTASGEGVWHNSSYISGIDTHDPLVRRNLFSCNSLPDCTTQMYFRDDGLSDLIGFEYQSWKADDAAADFVKHLVNIHDFVSPAPGNHVVSIILDGENAWEYYPHNAWHFIDALYDKLESHEQLNATTFADNCNTCPVASLPKICAGSWVYGTFSTWMGDKDKNLGWDLLVDAKNVYDQRISSLSVRQQEKASLQLAVCEGSDWFWWFGDYNPSDSVRDFDSLFRQQLRHLYTLLDAEIPQGLYNPVSHGGGNAENAGTMRRGHE